MINYIIILMSGITLSLFIILIIIRINLYIDMHILS